MTDDKYKFWDTVIKVLGFTASVVVLAFASYQYTGSLEKKYKKPFWESQLKTCLKVSQAASRRLGLRFSPKTAGVAGSVVIVGGTLIYYSALERMEDIRAVLMHRFQKGELTDGQYREVFGDTIDPDKIKRYWEM